MDSITTPWSVGIRLTHAHLQVLADDNGIDLLHIKGPAVDDCLLQVQAANPSTADAGEEVPVPRRSIDADVLVRPAHVDHLLNVMHRHGWSTAYRFEDGSAFEHASTLVHPFLAPVDVHRRFPGIDHNAEAAFERLWTERHAMSIAGLECDVPSVTAQRLLLIVHAVRGGATNHPDIDRSWTHASDEEKQRVQDLAEDLDAEVALGAGTGRLHEYRDARSYDLWRALSSGVWSFPEIWAARVKAAPSKRSALRTAVRLLIPNPHRMETPLGRPPTFPELIRAYAQRFRWGASELTRLVRARVGRTGEKE